MTLNLPNPGRFEERGFLGRGGAGDVYLAWDRQRGEEVALKLVRKAGADLELLEAERNGALLQQELGRIAPQVPSVYEIEEDDDVFLVVMEYIGGQDLSRVLAGNVLSEDRAIRIALQLCDFLNRLHNYSTEIRGRRTLGIVHGDIKPDNIRLLQNDKVRILDFGIAKQISLSRSFTTSLFGSLPYFPPERLERGEMDVRSDLWAIGVILYSMVSGHLPFAGSTPEEVELRLRRCEVLPLPESCSRQIRWVIYKSLSLDPEQRYSTAAAMQADLEALRDGEFRRQPPHEPEGLIAPSEEHASARPRKVTQRVIRRADHQETRRTQQGRSSLAARRSWLLPITLFVLLALLFTQIYVWRGAREIHREMLDATDSDIDAVWQHYQNVRHFSFFGWGLGGVGAEVAQASKRAANRILASYSGDDPRTTQEDWERAYGYLTTALDLDGNTETRARLMYTRGHIALSAAKSLEEQGDLEAARKKTDDAVSEFQNSAVLAPDWPDPYLSLARIYVYEQFDFEKLQIALKSAEQRGYSERRRLTAMRADGNLQEGRRLYSQSLKVRGQDGEEQILRRAASHLDKAIEFYEEIPGYAHAKRNQGDASGQLRLIENRLMDFLGDDSS